MGLNSYYHTILIIPLLLGVELIDSGKLDKEYINLLDDIQACLNEFWGLGSGANYTPIKDKSVFFPEIVKNPHKFIVA